MTPSTRAAIDNRTDAGGTPPSGPRAVGFDIPTTGADGHQDDHVPVGAGARAPITHDIAVSGPQAGSGGVPICAATIATLAPDAPITYAAALTRQSGDA